MEDLAQGLRLSLCAQRKWRSARAIRLEGSAVVPVKAPHKGLWVAAIVRSSRWVEREIWGDLGGRCLVFGVPSGPLSPNTERRLRKQFRL